MSPAAVATAEQSAPDAEARERIVDLRLGKQALGFGDFVDGSQAGLVARVAWLSAVRAAVICTGVLAAICARAVAGSRRRAFHCASQIDRDLLGARRLGANGGRLRGLARADGGAGRRPES